MAKTVIKKDGSREPFDIEKIRSSIKKAAQEAGLDEGRMNEVIEKTVSRVGETMDEIEEEISSFQIREEILVILDEIEASVSQAWREHDRKSKS